MTGTNWNGWKITDEQAEEIRNGNAEARNRFYLENLDRIRAMAYNYARENPVARGYYEDLAQGVLVDLLTWKKQYNRPIKDGRDISYFVRRSFYFATRGGYLYVLEDCKKWLDDEYQHVARDIISLDAPLLVRHRSGESDDGSTLLNFIPAEDCFREIEEEDFTEECKRIAGKYLSKQQKEFFEYWIEGYTPKNAVENMGVKQQSSLVRKMKINLIKNYAEIVAGLSCAGVNIPTYAQGIPEDFQTLTKPSTPEERKRTAERSRQWRKTHKLTPEQKARAVQRKREWRARKRQERNAQTATK